MQKKKLALLGCGYLNQIVANAYKQNLLPEYELVGALGRNPERTKAFAQYFGCRACSTIEELMDLKPDFTAEAASPKALREYAEVVLKAGSNLVVLSTGVFADASLYERVKKTAAENNTKVYIASGAVGGFDALRTAALMSPIKATMTSKKWPGSLYYTPLYKESLMHITKPERVYTATTKEAVEKFPYFFNVAIATALASAGPKNTMLNIDAVPNFIGDEYKIEIQGEEVAIDMDIYSRNYSIAGWSVVAVLQNAVSPIVF